MSSPRRAAGIVAKAIVAKSMAKSMAKSVAKSAAKTAGKSASKARVPVHSAGMPPIGNIFRRTQSGSPPHSSAASPTASLIW